MVTEKIVDVYFPENQADAVGARGHLESQDVRCMIVPLGDRAYPGILDRQLPWGVIRVDEDDVERAKVLLQEWQSAEREDLDEAFEKSDAVKPAPAPRGPRWGLIILLGALVFVLGVMMWSPAAGHLLPMR